MHGMAVGSQRSFLLVFAGLWGELVSVPLFGGALLGRRFFSLEWTWEISSIIFYGLLVLLGLIPVAALSRRSLRVGILLFALLLTFPAMIGGFVFYGFSLIALLAFAARRFPRSPAIRGTEASVVPG